MLVAKDIFSASPLLIHLLDLLRVPLKNSFDSYFLNFVDDAVDDIITDEENIIDIIHALRGTHDDYRSQIHSSFSHVDTLFPNDAENKR